MSGRAVHMSRASDAQRGRVRRNAWLLGALAVSFSLGILVWYVLRAQSGG